MKLILLKNVKYSYDTVTTVKDDDSLGYPYDKADEWVRLSEVIEVEFPKLDSLDIIGAEVDALETRITQVRADAEASVTALTGRIQELLAIECES